MRLRAEQEPGLLQGGRDAFDPMKGETYGERHLPRAQQMRFYRLFPAAFALRMKVDVDVLPELWSAQRGRAPGRADHGNV